MSGRGWVSDVSLGGLDREFLLAVADPQVMELIILPTERCNFRCVYCYEDFSIGKMSANTISAVKALITRRAPDLRRLNIAWFGGEPTLAIPTILDINQTARREMVASRIPNARFTSGITTNGYRLDWSRFAALVDVGVTYYQITLDGPREMHDSRRLRIDAKGTYEQIWRNLVTIAGRVSETSERFLIDLRVHFDRTSAYHLESLVDDICAELLPCGAFDVSFHEIEPLGGAFDSQLESPTQREYEMVNDYSRRIQEELGARDIQVTNNVSNYICYASKANAFVVRADGRIGKCTVALKDSRNDVGRLNADGTIEWFEGKLDPWLRGIPKKDGDILSCPFGGM